MRKYTMDNRKIPCPSVSFGSSRGAAKRGDGITFLAWSDGPINLGRVLGRIATCDSDGENCIGYAVVAVLSQNGNSIYYRWIKPEWIKSVFTMPTKIPAFFFGVDMMALDNDKLQYLESQGSLCESFIDNIGVQR